jgi:tetratricopeptide (TPR) repeat protein
MAESSTKAFGRYLKTLRERRNLSLDDVASLSQTFPEKINKGYLSRCENGHQKLGFSKVIALSRIIEVPADVLVERMELDLELDRVGGPDTEGMSYAELTEAGKKALEEGFFFEAYGFLRDAMQRAVVDPVRPVFRDEVEQKAIAEMGCGTAARALARYRFALHEFRYLESTNAFGPKFYPLILERISGCYRALKDFEAAARFADEAIHKAESHGDHEYLGYVYSNRARIASDMSDLPLATSFHDKAYRVYKETDHLVECVHALNNLAQCYFDLKRLRAARRAAEASQRLASDYKLQRSLALSCIILGELEELEERPARAVKLWKDAIVIAKELRDRELRFKAEFFLFRRALATNERAVARAIQRRLKRLSPWISEGTEELAEFKQLTADNAMNL